jgi:hypothetical protein
VTADDWARLDADPLVTISSTGSWLESARAGEES